MSASADLSYTRGEFFHCLIYHTPRLAPPSTPLVWEGNFLARNRSEMWEIFRAIQSIVHEREATAVQGSPLPAPDWHTLYVCRICWSRIGWRINLQKNCARRHHPIHNIWPEPYVFNLKIPWVQQALRCGALPFAKGEHIMLHQIFGRGCGCERKATQCNTSCDVLWIILLLMIVFNGGLFGMDICTLIILFVVFGGQLFGCEKHKAC